MTRRNSKKAPPARAVSATRWNWRILAFLAVVFLVKLAIASQLHDHVLLRTDTTVDSQTYVRLAARVAAGDVALSGVSFYMSPLYIYFLALVFKIAGSFEAARYAQVFFGTLSVWMVFATTREWFGQRAAWIAAIVASLTGLLTFYEILILQSSLDGVLTAAAVTSLTFALKRESRAWWIATGAAFALATLSRPNMLLPAVAIVLVLLLQRRRFAAVWISAGLATTFAPVVARNAIVVHEFTVTSSQGGVMFLQGNGDGANGLIRPLPNIRLTMDGQAEDTKRIAEAARGRALTGSEVSSYFMGLAWDWIRQHPGGWLRLLATKTFYLINSQHIALPLSYPFFAYDTGSSLRFLAVGMWLLLPLGLVGLVWPVMVFDSRERRDYLVWLTFSPVYILSAALFIVSERYRLPLLIPLVIGAGAAGDLLVSAVKARAAKAMAIAGASLALLAIVANWPLPFEDADGRGEERVHMAENVARIGDAAGAERWATLALERYPQKGLLHYRVGVQLTNSGNFAPAIAHLNAALAIDPTAAPVELALAQTYDAAGRCAEAIPHYRRALDLGLNEEAADALRALAACSGK